MLTSHRLSSTSSCASSSAFIQNAIETNQVVIFSKSYCPYCANTKNLFASLGITPAIYELDQMESGREIQASLQELTGQRTVPNVFVKSKHLGGNDDTVRAQRSGELAKLLK
jgi:glutaredoxin 3